MRPGALADSVGLGVEFLPIGLERGTGIEFPQVVLGHRQHSARTTSRIVQCANDALLGQGVAVLGEE